MTSHSPVFIARTKVSAMLRAAREQDARIAEMGNRPIYPLVCQAYTNGLEFEDYIGRPQIHRFYTKALAEYCAQ